QQLRREYRVSRRTTAWCTIALVVLVPATLAGSISLLQHTPTAAAITLTVLLLSGKSGVTRWWRILQDRRRLADEDESYYRELREREAEYERWVRTLEARRPSEADMEYWLDCDQTVFLDMILRHYGLKWHQVIAHTFLLTPRHGCRKRARSADGPWRYSDHEMRLFLITQDGVREAVTHHVFDHGKYRGQERDHFRFDAVSSIHVAVTDTDTYRLKLTLMNGRPKKITVVDETANEPGMDAELTPDR